MAPSTIRKAIGAVKDQTSISLAKVSGNIAPELEVLVVKATSHDNEPADEKYSREIINLTSYSGAYVSVCVVTISRRLSKTHDWIVAVKALMLVHRLLIDGHLLFEEEFVHAARRGIRILNMSDFRVEGNSNSWDHAGFVRFYAMFLDQKVDFAAYEKRIRGGEGKYEGSSDRFRDDSVHRMGSGSVSRSSSDLSDSMRRDPKKEVTPIREMRPERALGRLNQLMKVLDRILACRPAGAAKNSRLVLVALYFVVKESFGLYVEICELLGVLLDRFTEMEYKDCVKGFDTYVSAAKMIDELMEFYEWCKDVGVARSSEYPKVEKITDKLLGTLDGFLKEMANRSTSPERKKVVKEEEQELDTNEVNALPAPKNDTPPAPVPPPPSPPPQPEPHQAPNPPPQQVVEDLVNLKDDAISADEQGNKLALALFSEPPTTNGKNSWEAFPPNGEPAVTSAWQTPAAETAKADWESALMESTSNLAKQKAELAGGLDPLLLNGMYDQGAVSQHVSTTQLSGGSASSVTLPGLGKNEKPMLALPAPDGTFKPVGHEDPFAASLTVPPPAYVQFAEMERKQQFLVQEQQAWQQYGQVGMQAQVGLTNIASGSGQYSPSGQPMMPYSVGQPGGYYYGHY